MLVIQKREKIKIAIVKKINLRYNKGGKNMAEKLVMKDDILFKVFLAGIKSI